METKYYVDGQGNYIGGFAGALPPAGASEVPEPPQNAIGAKWNGNSWDELGAPDIPLFFDLLVKAIFNGAIPEDVHDRAEMVQKLENPADQAAALIALAANPEYTKEQKIALDQLIKAANLELPSIPVDAAIARANDKG